MKGFLRFCATLGGLLALCGFVLGLVGYALGGSPRYLHYGRFGWGWDDGPVSYAQETAPGSFYSADTVQEDVPHHEETHHGGHAETDFTAETALEPFTGLEIDLALAEVNILPGDSYGLSILGDGPAYRCYVEEGTLHLEAESDTLPGGGDLARLDHQTFEITLPAGTGLDEAELKMGAGSLYAEGFSCRELDAEVGMGELTLVNIQCTAEASLKAGMGELKASDLVCTGETEIDVEMGSVVLTGSLAGHVDIECGMGSAELTLADPGSYGYAVECGMGSVEIGGQNISNGAVSGGTVPADQPSSAAGVYYDVECGMGSVTIRFG